MKGIDRVYLVSAAASEPELEGKAINAAKNAGVKQVVKLSVFGADAPFEMFSKWHAQLEARLYAGSPSALAQQFQQATASLSPATFVRVLVPGEPLVIEV
jgi:uncharacterized protein YbjT (DUF2867 family)